MNLSVDFARIARVQLIISNNEYAEAYKDRGDALTSLGEVNKAKKDYAAFKKLTMEHKEIKHEVAKVYF